MGWLSLKIYKPNDSQEVNETYDFIDFLIDNDLPLEEKMLNLITSYENIRLTPGALEILIEKLLKKFGISIIFSRKGDNNTRYDALLSFAEGELEGIVEIEVPSTAMLDAPRNLLDDIAVRSNRNGLTIDKMVPIVICWTFPNNRTDYWNVINDIYKVLDIKIKTIPIMAIAVSYWTNTPLKLDTDTFYVDIDNNVLTEMIDLLTNEHVNLSNFEGYFAPFK